MITKIFNTAVDTLMWCSKRMGLSYNEVNVLLYYLILPLSWTIMLDCWFNTPFLSIALFGVWFGIFFVKWDSFRAWCDGVFMASVDFLNWFGRWGCNYVLSSVIICVFLPLTVYILLLWLIL